MTTTTQTKDDAVSLGRSVVEARLGACCQVSGPVTSTYWWDGELQSDEEWTCDIKTLASLVDDVLEHISERHPYENPELTVLPIVDGSDDYLEWIAAEVSQQDPGS